MYCRLNISNILIISFLTVLFACNSGNKKSDAHLHTTKDDLGREHHLPVRLKRVISLTPSITEILYEVTTDKSRIIARSQACDFPKEILSKPIINNYPIDIEALIKLKPEVVFVKNDMMSVEEAQNIENHGIDVFMLKFETCQDIAKNIDNIGKLMDEDIKAGLAVDTLINQLHHLKKETEEIEIKPNVLILISSDPVYVVGNKNFMSDILNYAGAKNIIEDESLGAFPTLNKEFLLQLNPDVIIVPGKNLDEVNRFFNLYPEMKKCNAFKNKRLYFVDESIISRPGPRIIQAIKQVRFKIYENK